MHKTIPVLIALLVAAPAALAASSTVSVVVDNAQVQGSIRDLQGVNKEPTFESRTPGISYAATSLYTAFGVSQARLRDGTLGLCNIYKAATRLNVGVAPSTTVAGCTLTGTGGIPHFMWTPSSSADADLNNPLNYDFGATDEAISKTLASGAKVYLGLWQDFNGPNDTSDPVAWAKVATNIYKHVIGAFKPTVGIAVDPAYVEIYNEPDGGAWSGDIATFITLYKETTTRVRAAAAAAGKTHKIGGAGFTRDVLTRSLDPANPANNFISAVGASSLDFYSAHLYGKCENATMPAQAVFVRNLRALVDTQGGSAKPLQITEWNIGLGQECGESLYSEQRNQSFASGVLTLMQDPSLAIEAAHYYAGVTVMSLFDFSSVNGAVHVNPAAWAFWAHAKLRGTSMLDAQVCQSSTCVAGYAAQSAALLVVAGQVSGGQEIVVTNDGTVAVDYVLQVKGLAAIAVDATISTPPTGAQDIAAAGTPIVADAKALTTLLASVTKDLRPAQTVSGGAVNLSITIPARTLQVIEVRTTGTSITTPAQSDCIFSWAERTYPQYFATAGTSATAAPYYYRYYATTKNYLASSTDNQVYVLGPVSGNKVLKVGSAASFLAAAGCSQ